MMVVSFYQLIPVDQITDQTFVPGHPTTKFKIGYKRHRGARVPVIPLQK